MLRLMMFLVLGIAVGLAAALYISARDELEAATHVEAAD